MSPSDNGERDQGRQPSLFDEDKLVGTKATKIITDGLDEEPKSNSPEDLGMVTPNAPPASQAYGKPAPEPERLPKNFARSAMQHADAVKFRDWIYSQEDLPTHARVTLGGIVCGLSGLGHSDLRWLCQAILQAETAPSPDLMRRAVLTHDVSVLREDEDEKD